MDFDWNDAKAFLRTAETGSLTAASKILRTSQPTVGRRISALEKNLGIVLFERSKNNLFLTPQGERIVEVLQGMEKVASETIIVAKGATLAHIGTVTIAVSEIGAVFTMPAMISELKKLEPTIQIRLEVSNDTADLLHRNADIAIRHYRPEEEALIIRKIGSRQVSLYGTPELCKTFRNANLNGQKIPIIGFNDTDFMTQILVTGGLNEKQIDYVSISDFQLSQIELAKRGLGFILLPVNFHGTISELECLYPDSRSLYEYSSWLVSHSELRKNKRIRFVYDFLSTQLEKF
ncbi:LysR family transcriptional regulator [Alteromonas gracilis]|uniref:LysR family transcriptional regulator n=1 Tax=Alteromonas gracilis TaxID=1479524 RepID=UPI0030CD095B